MSAPIPEWTDDLAPAKKRKAPPHTLSGCLVILLLSVLLCISALVLGIQTKVGCEMVADFFQRQTGLDVMVGGASLAWPLEVVMTDVQTKPSTTPLGSFKAREIRVGYQLDGSFTLVLKGARLEMVKIADGWAPAAFLKIATLSDVRDTAALVGSEPRLSELDIRDSGLLWSGGDGERLASADGLGVSMRSVNIGDRRLMVLEVTARNVYRNGGVKGLSVRRLWLSAVDNPYLEVEYRGIWDGNEANLKDWWSAPPGVVKRGL